MTSNTNPLVVSLVPRVFRSGQAPNFAEMADIIYSWKDTEFFPVEDLFANEGRLSECLTSRFGRIPDVVVVYEPWDANLFRVLPAIPWKIVLITEDLHLRPLPLLKAAVDIASLVLARFNTIEEILGERLPNVRSFPLHCSNIFLGEPQEETADKILHFGNLHTDPPNINPLLSPGANQYEFRQRWHDLLTEKAGDKYEHIRVSPEELRLRMRATTFGFSCTYFPYSFLDKCAEEQGDKWAEINRPVNASASYLVAKFLEIPGSGMLMVADPTGVEAFLDDAGFTDRANYVAITLETIDETLSYLFDPANKDELERIRSEGHKLVATRHSIGARKTEYANHLQSLFQTAKA